MNKPSDAELGRQFGVDGRTIRTWRKEDAPLGDPQAMSEWIAERHRGPVGREPSTLSAAKLRKIELECERLAMGNAETKGDLVAKKTVIADMRVIAAAMMAMDNALIGECPAWAGLKPHELQHRAKEHMRRRAEVFHDKASACYGPL